MPAETHASSAKSSRLAQKGGSSAPTDDNPPSSAESISGPKARVTQNDIALVAGVHNTTVSLCLRNCPSIPEPTRRRIQALAEKMGYYPDPALRALIAYRNGRRPQGPQQTIAYVTNGGSRMAWHSLAAQECFHAGAQRGAARLGYLIEHFWLGEDGMNLSRLSHMLYHRGIAGAVLALQRDDDPALLDYDFARLSAVKISQTSHFPPVHRVINDQANVVRLAVAQVQAAGYERIGLALPVVWDAAVGCAWSQGFLALQAQMPASLRVPLLAYQETGAQGHAAVAGELAGWWHEHRPEVVLAFSPVVAAEIERLGFSIPGDVAFVNLFLDFGEGRFAGVRQNCERVGELAVEMLVAQMMRNVHGIPAVPTTTLTENLWIAGDTLPSLRLRSVS